MSSRSRFSPVAAYQKCQRLGHLPDLLARDSGSRMRYSPTSTERATGSKKARYGERAHFRCRRCGAITQAPVSPLSGTLGKPYQPPH